MEQKSYSQMHQEFYDLYHNEIEKTLPKYNEKRRKNFPKIVAFSITWFSFLAMFVLLMAGGFINEKFIVFGLLMLPIVIVEFVVIFYLTRNDKKNSDGSVTINSNLESELKLKYMHKLVSIFLRKPTFAKSNSAMVGKYWSTVKNIREQKILNPFPFIVFDDMIDGIFKDVKINIFESDTRIFQLQILMLGVFLLVFCTFMTLGLFAIVLPFVILLFSWKIFQYSPFRGVIVEFRMNKNFKGHTFFHDNALTAKKIPFNKKIYKKVNLESVSFNKKYNVYSDDQIEARYVLTTAFMDRIENLKFAFKAKYVRGSFKDNKLMLAIHTGKDMFAMGSDSKDTSSETFKILYEEMISMLQIIDTLKIDVSTGL